MLFMQKNIFLCVCMLITVSLSASEEENNWLQWRAHAGHTATIQRVAEQPKELVWTRHFPIAQAAWTGHRYRTELSVGAGYPVVVSQNRCFIASMIDDTVRCLSVDTGAEEWSFTVDAPIRYAPVCWNELVIFASDDGYVYACDQISGEEQWRFRPGPKQKGMLGHGRLMHAWAIGAGPVSAEDKLYVVGGIWPTMGISVYCLNPRDGSMVWVNEDVDARFMRDPKSLSMNGLAPQGYAAVVDGVLLIPNGRNRPIGLNAETGKELFFLTGRNGGSIVGGDGPWFWNGTALVAARTGDVQMMDVSKRISFNHVVGDKNALYFARYNFGIGVIDLQNKKPVALPEPERINHQLWKKSKQMGQQHQLPLRYFTEEFHKSINRLWCRTGDLLLGTTAVGARDKLSAVDCVDGTLVWQYDLDGKIVDLIPLGQRLLVQYNDGRVVCLSSQQQKGAAYHYPLVKADISAPVIDEDLQAVIETLPAPQTGHVLVIGKPSAAMVRTLAQNHQHATVLVDESDVQPLRAHYLSTGQYGLEVVVWANDQDHLHLLPPFVHQMIIALEPLEGLPELTPAGGYFYKRYRQIIPVETAQDGSYYTQPLVGAGAWSHEDGDANRSFAAQDTVVRPPLGILSFSGEDGGTAGFKNYCNSHTREPRPQIHTGRMIVKGVDGIQALNAYTGQLLWKRYFDGYDLRKHFSFIPFAPAARLQGGALVTTSERVYVNTGQAVHILDARNGTDQQVLKLEYGNKRWGYCSVNDDCLLVGYGTLAPQQASIVRRKGRPAQDTELEGVGLSAFLRAYDDDGSKQRWDYTAQYAIINNSIVAGNGRVMFIDAPPKDLAYGYNSVNEQENKRLRQAFRFSSDARLVCLSVVDGTLLWTQERNIFGGRLQYDLETNIVVQSMEPGGVLLANKENGLLIAHDADTGEELWQYTASRSRPWILRKSHLYPAETNRFLNGKHHVIDIRTGAAQPFPYVYRSVGEQCSGFLANEHIMLYRASSAGWSDPAYRGGTVNIPGIKPGCTENMIPASGVVAISPLYAASCRCQYQLQCQITLHHDPDMEYWSYGAPYHQDSGRLALNFGAPGDRLQGDTLWLDYPSESPSDFTVEARDFRDGANEKDWDYNLMRTVTGKQSPIQETGSKRTLRRHSLRLTGDLPWVSASQMIGVEHLHIQMKPGTYRVHALFSELEHNSPEKRVFSLSLNGKEVLSHFDPFIAAGAAFCGVKRDLGRCSVTEEGLNLNFIPHTGEPSIAGLLMERLYE